MTKLAEPTVPPKPKTPAVQYGALLLAGLLTVMVVAQLFKFEEMIPLVESFGLGGGESQATILVSVLVIAQVFALPFLLRMYVSPLMRVTSMVLGWVAATLWLYMMVGVYMTVNAVGDSGFLGTTVTVPFGWWSVAFAVLLVGLAGWASWGMWPTLTRPARATK
ncbi:hypothetical protein [Pedobacter sp.]|uniref:hypothetical protein n=1 Tax=Pedobacter sp. TaxID=1411316 RepID=UPI003D7FD823